MEWKGGGSGSDGKEWREIIVIILILDTFTELFTVVIKQVSVRAVQILAHLRTVDTVALIAAIT